MAKEPIWSLEFPLSEGEIKVAGYEMIIRIGSHELSCIEARIIIEKDKDVIKVECY